MIPSFIQNSTMLVKIVSVIFALFIAGMIIALFLPSKEATPPTQQGNASPLFLDLRLGTPVRASFATQVNPPIKQKAEYTVNEPIMMQGTTTSSATEPVEVSVRLLDEKSRVVPLSPNKVTLKLGTNSFCCWNVKTPGEYVMQVFRPDSVVTRLPLRIVKDFETTTTDK